MLKYVFMTSSFRWQNLQYNSSTAKHLRSKQKPSLCLGIYKSIPQIKLAKLQSTEHSEEIHIASFPYFIKTVLRILSS